MYTQLMESARHYHLAGGVSLGLQNFVQIPGAGQVTWQVFARQVGQCHDFLRLCVAFPSGKLQMLVDTVMSIAKTPVKVLIKHQGMCSSHHGTHNPLVD